MKMKEVCWEWRHQQIWAKSGKIWSITKAWLYFAGKSGFRLQPIYLIYTGRASLVCHSLCQAVEADSPRYSRSLTISTQHLTLKKPLVLFKDRLERVCQVH